MAGLVLGRRVEGITVGRSEEARAGAGALEVAPGLSCVCVWWRLTHKARGLWEREEAGVATLLEQVRSKLEGRGVKGLGTSVGEEVSAARRGGEEGGEGVAGRGCRPRWRAVVAHAFPETGKLPGAVNAF